MEKRIAEIIARCKAIDAAQADIERKAELENEGKFTDAQRTEYSTLKTEYDTLIAEKKQLETDAQMRAERSGRATELQPAVIERRSQPNAAAPVVTNGQLPGHVVERTADQDDEPVIRFKIPQKAMRIGSPRSFRGTVNGISAEHRAYKFGMWALAAISQQTRYKFPSATKFVNDYMGPLNTAHGETDGTTGGSVLVPEEFSSDLIVLREQYGVSRRLFRRSPMMSDVKHEPKRLTGLTAYFTAESAAITESNMTWQDIQLVAKDIACLSRMSNQLSADAAISVGDEMAGEMAYAFANKEDDCAFNGDGTSTYGGIQGARKILDDIDGAGTDSIGKVIQGTSNTWATQVLGDFNKVVGILPQFADTPNTCWVCHRSYYGQTMQRLEFAAGGNSAANIQGGERGRPMFLGYPVEFSQVMTSATATTGVHVLLGDFSIGGLFGDRSQTSIAFSDSAVVGGESVFERNQIAIRGVERFDINVHGCGTASVYGPIVGLATA